MGGGNSSIAYLAGIHTQVYQHNTISTYVHPYLRPSPVIDIGINFTDKTFNKDLSECISAAHAADVTKMIVTGTNIEGSQQAAQLVKAHPDSLFPPQVFTPHHAKDWRPNDYETLKKLAHVITLLQ